MPELARWIWGSHDTFVEVIEAPAHGALRDRAVVARCLEITACGMPHDIDPELMGRTLKMLQPLLFHPEPLVWIHAARALGRLTGPMEQLVGTLLDWVQGDSPIIRQRAITAFASVPAHRLGFLAPHLAAIIKSPDNDPFVLAAVAATPYLFFERQNVGIGLRPRSCREQVAPLPRVRWPRASRHFGVAEFVMRRSRTTCVCCESSRDEHALVARRIRDAGSK